MLQRAKCECEIVVNDDNGGTAPELIRDKIDEEDIKVKVWVNIIEMNDNVDSIIHNNESVEKMLRNGSSRFVQWELLV